MASNEKRARALTDASWAATLHKLEAEYGNRLSADHRSLLQVMLKVFSETYWGTRKPLRIAWPLQTGMGKTTAITQWIAEAFKLDRCARGVLVCASRVEANCDMARALVGAGVPRDSIGLIHSHEDGRAFWEAGRELPDDTASEPADSRLTDRPIMIVTHANVRQKQDVALRYSKHQDRPRTVIFWDESCFVGHSFSIKLCDLEGNVVSIERRARQGSGNDHLASFSKYLRQGWGQIESVLSQIEASEGSGCDVIQFEQVAPETIDHWSRTLRWLGASRYPAAAGFLNLCQLESRIVPGKRGDDAAIAHRLCVPDELRSLQVLDASQPIRVLLHLDTSIKPATSVVSELASIQTQAKKLKRYSNLVIHQNFTGGGRRSILTDLRTHDRPLQRLVVETIQKVPTGEPVLVFCFKDRQHDPQQPLASLKRALRHAGVNLEETLEPPGGETPVPRIAFETFGNEEGQNRWRHARHVILYGAFHKDESVIASQMVAQRRDLRMHLAKLAEMQQGEVHHSILQAASRGCCRFVDNGEARPMDLYLIHRDPELRLHLDSVFPGARWTVWGDLAKGRGKAGAAATRISEYLESVPEDQRTVSFRVVKRELPLELGKDAWSSAKLLALNISTGWVISNGGRGRSFERTSNCPAARAA